MVNRNIIIVFFLLSAISSTCVAGSLPEQLDDEIQISSSVKVSVSIQTITVSSGSHLPLAERWGADDSPQMIPPKRIITDLKVIYGGERVILPASSFTDLCDLRVAKLRKIKQGFKIDIKGGDAGTAYSAVLIFEGNKLIRRKVVVLEAPSNAWEETVYHSEFPSDW